MYCPLFKLLVTIEDWNKMFQWPIRISPAFVLLLPFLKLVWTIKCYRSARETIALHICKIQHGTHCIVCIGCRDSMNRKWFYLRHSNHPSCRSLSKLAKKNLSCCRCYKTCCDLRSIIMQWAMHILHVLHDRLFILRLSKVILDPKWLHCVHTAIQGCS